MLARALDAAPRRDPVTRATVADLLTYLPGDLLVKVDLASMAHSLECRGPFLDHRVVELALAMPIRRKLRLRRGRSKVVLKQAFADLLPPAIRHRPKMGFGVPIDRWFRDELKDELRAVLLDPVALARGLFRPEAVAALIDEHVAGPPRPRLPPLGPADARALVPPPHRCRDAVRPGICRGSRSRRRLRAEG